jgi:hypothetical protein
MADQTIGKNTYGATNQTAETWLAATKFQAPAVAGGGTCTFYVGISLAAEPYPSVKCGVWADSSGDPGALLASGPALTPSTTGEQWLSGTFTWEGIEASAYYWLGGVFESTAGEINLSFESTGGTSVYKSGTYPTLPDPFGSKSDIERIYSFYVLYPATTAKFARTAYYYAQQ